MKSSIKKSLVTAISAAALGFAAMAPAQAAIIVGSFDPAFGNGFTNLSWEGSVQFKVPEACLSLNASAVGADNACTAGEKMEIQSAYVDLYNTNNPAVRERLDFNTSTLRMNIEDISVSNGDVIGLNTVLEIYFDDEWSVEWFGDWAKPSQTSLLTGVATGYQKYNYGLYLVDGVAELRASSTFSNNIFGCKVDEVPICVSEITPTVTFTRLDTPPTVVPEPTSMALFFGALGAAGWVRRRKSRQA